MNPTKSITCASSPSGCQLVPLPLLEAALLVAWSSGFVGARFSLDYAPPLLVVFWRCVLVTLLLFPFVARELRQISPMTLVKNAGIGLLAMAGYLAGITQGIALGVPAGLAALFADLLPMGLALLAAGLLGQRMAPRVWAGLVIGLAGVALGTHGALAWGNAPLWVYGLPLLGMLSLAAATLWQKHLPASQSMGLLPNLWLQCCVSGVAFALIEGSQGSLAPIPSTGFAVSVLWTAGLSTVGGYGLYWLCLRRASATRVASVLYLSPPITMVWAWAMFDEPLSWQMALGMAVSAVGIWMVVREEAREARRRRPHGTAAESETVG
ncbi:DMT family transporter [Pseudomonas frederiksbergensis]|jgi:drug/metabolite transporter (DMT)-like permease|uniref:Membrane protein n=1 Tax=Pseudomonas frederiksbergensis TaxID=104087 RepID=A0A0B1Z2L6_9PSED|nr:DMT family transporter [Pseudomonas frederiksbergensis]KHK64870.1 membrane protein [Pseudomonas frederiksbergensis]